jgi:hypothetical protein
MAKRVTQTPHENALNSTDWTNMLTLLLIIALAAWCWFGSGPLFLRWPSVVVLVLLTSGHTEGAAIGGCLDKIAAPILVSVIMAIGLAMMLRAHMRRRYQDYPLQRRSKYRHGNRW